MPEIGPETKPEAKQGEAKPSEAKPEEKPETSQEAPRWRDKGYVDYDSLTPETAAVMLKRIRARMKRIERDIDVIMAILKYGPQGGSQGQGRRYQGQNQGGEGQGRYQNQGGYKKSYGNRQYGRYGGRRYGSRSQRRRNEEDVNYE